MLKDVEKIDMTTKDKYQPMSSNIPLLYLGVVYLWISYAVIFMFRGINIEEISRQMPLGVQALLEMLVRVFLPALVFPMILASVTLYFAQKTLNKEQLKKRRFGGYRQVSLTENRFAKWLLKKRWFQWILQAPMTVLFIGVAIFGIYGYGGYIQAADAGFINATTFLTWNIWFPSIIISFVVVGRVWCTMCPLGCIGEWAHRTHKPENSTTPKLIVRFFLAFFFGMIGSMVVGVTIGLFAGFSAESLMGSGQLSSDFLLSIFEYLVYLVLAPVTMVSEVFSSINSNFLLGGFWILSITVSFVISALFGFILPEFGKAMVYGTPMRQKEDPKRVFPKKLRSMWITTVLFVLIISFDFVIGMFVTPLLTSLFLLILIAFSIILGLIYERRAFCMYICPLGGLIGTFSMLSTFEIRSKDLNVCKDCKGKFCINGRTSDVVEDRKGNKTTVTWSSGYACPMGEFPMIMDRNMNCIMCTECFKSCPYDNISLNLRTPIVDTYNPKKRRFDQAGLTVVLIAIAFLFIIPSIHLPFFEISLIQGLGGPIIVAIVSIFFFLKLSKWRGNLKDKTTKDLFNLFSFSIIPIGFSIWLSFWLMRIFDHSLSILKVLADPFGGIFMAQSIYNSSGLILDNPITFPVALFYLLNPLFHLGLHTMDFGPLVTRDFSFAFRIMVVLLGMVASLYSAHRAIFLNWDYDEKKNLKILIPIIAWIIFATFLGLFAVANQF